MVCEMRAWLHRPPVRDPGNLLRTFCHPFQFVEWQLRILEWPWVPMSSNYNKFFAFSCLFILFSFVFSMWLSAWPKHPDPGSRSPVRAQDPLLSPIRGAFWSSNVMCLLQWTWYVWAKVSNLRLKILKTKWNKRKTTHFNNLTDLT